MFTRLRGRHPAGLIGIGVVITLVLSGTAMAVTDTSFTYSTVQTGYLMIGPGDLVPTNGLYAEDFQVYHGSASSYVGGCFIAGVHVPQGARITSVRTSYISGGSADLYHGLIRVNPVTGAEIAVIPLHFVTDDTLQRTFVNDLVPANLGFVNNGLFTYTYQVCVEGATAFYGSRITYQYTTAGD